MTLASLASRADWRNEPFLRRFRKATGLTAIDYCQRLRVGKARELLQFTCTPSSVHWRSRHKWWRSRHIASVTIPHKTDGPAATVWWAGRRERPTRMPDCSGKRSKGRSAGSNRKSALIDYATFLESQALKWYAFPMRKEERCLVRYRGALVEARNAGLISPSTATMRMRQVVHFYRWVQARGLFSPASPLWCDRIVYISYFDSVGFEGPLRGLRPTLRYPIARGRENGLRTVCCRSRPQTGMRFSISPTNTPARSCFAFSRWVSLPGCAWDDLRPQARDA